MSSGWAPHASMSRRSLMWPPNGAPNGMRRRLRHLFHENHDMLVVAAFERLQMRIGKPHKMFGRTGAKQPE